jgi:hypothetical protein
MRQMSEPRTVILFVFNQSAVRCSIWYSVRCREASGGYVSVWVGWSKQVVKVQLLVALRNREQ